MQLEFHCPVTVQRCNSIQSPSARSPVPFRRYQLVWRSTVPSGKRGKRKRAKTKQEIRKPLSGENSAEQQHWTSCFAVARPISHFRTHSPSDKQTSKCSIRNRKASERPQNPKSENRCPVNIQRNSSIEPRALRSPVPFPRTHLLRRSKRRKTLSAKSTNKININKSSVCLFVFGLENGSLAWHASSPLPQRN